jgi:DNA-binding Lrp family transcriptional regulator
MNDLQKQILNIIQADFPIEARPFAKLAGGLDSSETEIISQIDQLKQQGIIRRIGAIFDSAHLGYVSTLVAGQVPAEKLEAFVSDVNSLPGVSHNYGREHKYNVWFTLTMPSERMIDETINRLRQTYSISAIYSLPAEKLFKIKVQFDFIDQKQDNKADVAATHNKHIVRPFFSDFQIALIRQLQEDLCVIPEPFKAIAETVEIDVDTVLRQIKDWKGTGLIRRFGVSIRHQQAGFAANAMVVFQVVEQQLDKVGSLLTQYPQVSHCYRRPTAPDWPYNLFAMTHCRTEQELHQLIDEMVRRIRPQKHDMLSTIAEYKKTSVSYFTEQK